MHAEIGAVRAMPDIAQDAEAAVAGALDWVGMDRIDVPVRLPGHDGEVVTTAARVAAYVNLSQPDVRGIHMSRLYLAVERALSNEPLTPCALRRLLREFLDSHADLSDRAMVRVVFDHLVRRPALKSDTGGWKSYPVTIAAVGRASLDATGIASGTESRSVGGEFADETFTGTYSVNADCTGTATINFYESGQLVRTSVLSMVFDANNREIRMVQKSLQLPDGAFLPVVVTVEAKRIFTEDD